MNADQITVAVCTRDRPVLLRRCLESVQPQIDGRSQLLVVDSAASGPEVRQIADHAAARYVAASRPGLDVARNLALRAARGEIIAFIDDDAVATQGWLEALRDAFSDPSVVCVTGRVLALELGTTAQRCFESRFSFDRGTEPLRFLATDDRPRFPVHPYHLGTGCNMAFRRRVFDRIGGFDESLDAGTPVGGGGDLDIFRRLLCAGFTALYRPDALVYHKHRETQREARRQFWAYGKSYTALLTKSLLVERSMRRQAWLLMSRRPREQGRRLVRILRREYEFPLELVLVETLGNLAGPLVYLYSLLRVRYAQAAGEQLGDGPITIVSSG